MLHHFDIDVNTRPDGVAVLKVDGELDLASAPQFRQAVGELMGEGRRRVVVDLSGSDFVDSSGIGAILWADNRLKALGGRLTTTGCTPHVVRVLELSGLGSFVH